MFKKFNFQKNVLFLKILELTFPNVSSNSLLFIRVLIVKTNFHKTNKCTFLEVLELMFPNMSYNSLLIIKVLIVNVF